MTIHAAKGLEFAHVFIVGLEEELFPQQRKGEAEDKDKLDKEFKDKTQKMAEKLKKEQFHDKWIYLFDHYAMDNLLKKRVELMAEKKDETKKDDAPPKPPGIPGVGPLPNLDQ